MHSAMTTVDTTTTITDTITGTITGTIAGLLGGPGKADDRPPVLDLYRDIHKGIRAELFAITSAAGSIDPADRADRVALFEHVSAVAAVLESHAHHEDDVIDPVLAVHRPDLAESIAADHTQLEASFGAVTLAAEELVFAAGPDRGRLARTLYLDLARFTGAYLVHQDVEERIVMPAIEQAVGVPAVVALHERIVSSIPPDEMARCLAFMLPAMNVDDRCEMLGGMRAAAPAPAFDAVVGLARSVLRPAEFDAIGARLGLVM
jgi:Hemerythrin HHE cation binding domain